MSNWVITIAGACFLFVLSSFILADSSIGKYVKSIFSLLIIPIILTPILNVNDSEVDIFNSAQIDLQTDYLSYINKKHLAYYQSECENVVNNLVKNATVTIEHVTENDIVKIKKVIVNFDESVINENSEHIVIVEAIKDNLSKFLNISEKNVVVNGK